MNALIPPLRGLAAVLLAASLSACIVVPAHRGPYGGPYGGVIVAPEAPPPAPVEVVPAIPFVGALWIAGYWNWVGHRHVWVPGRWEAPRQGHQYEPRRWAPTGGGYELRGGWRER